MGLFDKIKKKRSSVIQWEKQEINQLWFKFSFKKDEINNVSKLIVAPGQGCVLVYNGKIENIIKEEGVYNLKSDINSFIDSLLKFRKNSDSKHKLDIYFYKITEVFNQSWSNLSTVKYLDPVDMYPIEITINAEFSYKINNVNKLFCNALETKERFTVFEAKDIIVKHFPQQIAMSLAKNKLSYKEVNNNLDRFTKSLIYCLNIELEEAGLELSDFKVVEVKFDKDTTRKINKKNNSIPTETKIKNGKEIIKNEESLAGAGIQLTTGLIKVGNVGLNGNNTHLDEEKDELEEDSIEKLRKLKILLDENIITKEEFDMKKRDILLNF